MQHREQIERIHGGESHNGMVQKNGTHVARQHFEVLERGACIAPAQVALRKKQRPQQIDDRGGKESPGQRENAQSLMEQGDKKNDQQIVDDSNQLRKREIFV